ncbi:phage tail sheath family protein [Streptomyces sp. AV19]|uniref:phage tail sheath family protein n=1 Tax=Streptomyces sp. AV19 TaxID=2793068 RepID=UPI0018FEEDF4|nr:phage tail sheath subtilisin-like domain-containing protein [Streptomyces sp. AV19]MBH1934416.1 phage tail sheath family protein [Streptomyces sp. AV19]MDG4536270.1 phage tail sheath subtilisin-like domain-containing protein [Streptomyces sp. AV19]
MPDPNPPGVFVKELPSGVRTITGASTSVPAFLGYTRVSPKDGTDVTPRPFTEAERKLPQKIGSWREFAARYSMAGIAEELAETDDSTLIPTLERCFPLAEAVYGFFANGGRTCYVVGFTNPANAVIPTELKGDVDARTGLAGLETVPEVTMVAVPSLWDMTKAATSLDPPDQNEGKARMDEVLKHCTEQRNRLAILDPPPDLESGDMKAFAGEPGSSDTDAFATLYYPWITVPGVNAEERTVPPCGHIAGVWARTDAERGVFKAPANQNLRGVLKLDTLLTDDEHGELNQAGVNCLRVFPDRGLLVWGARTRSSTRDWKYLNVRRLVSFLSDSIRQSSTWAVFEPNDERLWATLRHSVSSFLTDQWRQGALAGRTPDEAFYVICDATNNRPESMDEGKVVCDIGVAPVRPAEFVHFTITQIAGQSGQTS